VAYAELVPVIVEAFKVHMAKYETDQENVQSQFVELRNKLDKMESRITSVATKPIDNSQLPLPPEQMWAQQKDFYPHYAFPPEPKVINIFPPTQVIPVPEEPKRDNKLQRTAFRTTTIVVFFLGVATIIFGSILLGLSLSSPAQTITVSVVEALGLKAMDQDGVPDPYCEVWVGASIFRTDTIWNTANPLFDVTFPAQAMDDQVIKKVIFQIYDDNHDSSPKSIGLATLQLDRLSEDSLEQEELKLVPAQSNDSVSGSIKVALLLAGRKTPTYEVAILLAGVFLTAVSMVLGFYTWRANHTKKNL